MKKLKFLVILILFLSFGNVYAKDTVYSFNKFKDERLSFIENSINEEGKIDGILVAGNYLKEEIKVEENTYNDYQILLIKYRKNGDVAWTYSYGNTKEDNIDSLTYTYDEEGNIDGYLFTTTKSFDVLTEAWGDSYSVLVKIDLEGKLVFEKEIEKGIITKLIPIKEEKSYIGLINTPIGSSIIKLNHNYDIEWEHNYEESCITELSFIKKEDNIVGYAIIKNNELIELDIDGKEIKTIDNLEKYLSSHLVEAKDGFILYGVTDEVKLKKGKTSYYLIKYNEEGELIWEVVGDSPVNPEKIIVLLNNNLLLYKNEVDSSYEVLELNDDGIMIKKVKKLINDYYDFENYYSYKDTLYFIGQINCPQDDNCDYDENSLLLISDEDKVIEVEDKDSTSILIITGIFLGLTISFMIMKKRRRLK